MKGAGRRGGAWRDAATRFGLAAALFLALDGCGAAVGALGGEPEPAVVVALFDVSGSTSGEKIRRRYDEQFHQIVEALGPGDRVVADVIGESPLARSTFPVNTEFPPFNAFADNRIVWERRVAAERDTVLNTADSVLAAAGSAPVTPISEALQLAQRVFRIYPAKHRALVLFSDMVEESERWNFTRRLSVEDARAMVAREQAEGRLPDLAGVRVYVVGAASGTYERMSLGQREAIRTFWGAYLKAAGADFSSDRYGSALLAFDPRADSDLSGAAEAGR